MAGTILLVEDNADTAFLVARELRVWGFEVVAVYSAREALGHLAKHSVDCVVLDYLLPDLDTIVGLQDIWNGAPDLPKQLAFLGKLRSDYPRLPIGLVSAFGTDEVAAEALQSIGAKFYISKHGREWVRNLAKRISEVLRRAVFEQRGGQWFVAWSGVDCWFADKRGFHLIHLLLARPGDVLTSSELWAAVSYDPDMDLNSSGFDVDLPIRRGDEKTRTSVQKNIKAAIDDVRANLPNLADYLKIHIRTGYYCTYVRDLERPIPWVL